MNLAIDPQTGNRRDRATIRKLLQMRACDKIPDTDTRARLIREGLIEKLWLEKQLKANTERDHLNHHSAIRTCLFVIF